MTMSKWVKDAVKFSWKTFREGWWTFANGFCTSVVLPGILIFLILLLTNQVGRGLGLPLLMWVGGPDGGPAGWRQFFIGIGVAVLVWQVLLGGYIAEEFATNYTIDRPPFCEVRGMVGTGRFRYIPTKLSAFGLYSATIIASMIATGIFLQLAKILIQNAFDWSGEPFDQAWESWTPEGPAHAIPQPPYSICLPGGFLAGILLMMSAWKLATAWQWGTSKAEALGRWLTEKAGQWGHAAGRRAKFQPGGPSYDTARLDYLGWFLPYNALYGLFTLTFFVVLCYTIILSLCTGPTGVITPAGWILFLLHLAAFVSVMLSYFIPLSNQFVVLILAGLVLLGGRTYKIGLPNLPYGKAPVRLAEQYKRMAEEDSRPPPPASDHVAAIPPSGPIPTDLIPYARRDQAGKIDRKPPIALVCVSGGGSRSALWTMKVLGALESEFGTKAPGRDPIAFPYHIRLMTGASGGMLAAGAFAADLRPPQGQEGASGWPAPARRLLGPEALVKATQGNFLAPAIAAFGDGDLWRSFVPSRADSDRGWAIEAAWRSAFALDPSQAKSEAEENGKASGRASVLDRTFDDLRPGEAAGWRPSLIFSPMLVEDGRQLFITNLQLQKVTRNLARILEKGRPAGGPIGLQLLSREGIEFFELFPDSRSGFQVGTAARMSGSFPYVLPAPILPTDPPRRVVDAGYYDNYGVGIAASWLANNLDWVRRETSGVVLIQIRDGASNLSRRREKVDDTFPDLFARGLQGLTSPPEGLWQTRVASSVYRNDNLLHIVTELLEAKGLPAGFFTTATFEFEAGQDVSLSWALTKTETDLINTGMGEIDPLVKSVVQWWHERLNSKDASP